MSTSSSSLVVKSHTSLVHSTYGTCEKISHCFRFLLFPGIHVIIPCDLTHWNLPAGVSNTSWAICHIHTVTCHMFTHAYSVWIHTQTFYWNPVFSYAARLKCHSQRPGSVVTTATLNFSNSSHTSPV